MNIEKPTTPETFNSCLPFSDYSNLKKYFRIVQYSVLKDVLSSDTETEEVQ
jgi:hypothetical protein